ncbi:kinase-like domain-containing protein [Triangularia setosa]|uniref:Kinase-like domain-containing protein n=1 Tax=Triangularia setosa TaxID=2587417 RepID=A0AAN6W698_9PEZI|nr:kinase-like domain-containing protein [Podospora setosa]
MFVKHTIFDRIICPERVLQVVSKLKCYRRLSDQERMEVAKDIYFGTENGRRPSCRRLLAALIWIDSEAVEYIKDLMYEGMSDDCLPLLVVDYKKYLLDCRHPEHTHPTINKFGGRRLGPRRQLTAFFQTLMAPYIRWEEGGLHCHYVMKGGGPLPIQVQSKIHDEGDFGEVYKVKIDPGDRHFTPEKPTDFFALKKLKQHMDPQDPTPADTHAKEFDLEIRSLIFAESRAERLLGPTDEYTKNHLIQLLATFEVYDSNNPNLEPTFYMLFDWADGNLKQFWKENSHNAKNPVHCGWMIEQFYRLAKALQCVHNERQLILRSGRTDSNVFGRHGDIKPSNLLFFQGRRRDGQDILVMGDFGMGRMHSKGSKSKQPASERRATVTYEAPEFELKDGTVSPKTDIFSLGCVYLEYVTWLLMDYNVLDAFADARTEEDIYGFESDTFYNVSKYRDFPRLKKGVKNWIQKLRDHPDCVEVIGELLEIIEKDMLNPDQHTRANSEELAHKLGAVWRKWQRKDSLYGERHWRDSEIVSAATDTQDPGAATLAFQVAQELLWRHRTNRASQKNSACKINARLGMPAVAETHLVPPITDDSDGGLEPELGFTLKRSKTLVFTAEPELQGSSDSDADKFEREMQVEATHDVRGKRSIHTFVTEDERHRKKRK